MASAILRRKYLRDFDKKKPLWFVKNAEGLIYPALCLTVGRMVLT